MLDSKIIEVLDREISSENLMGLVERIWHIDWKYTYPAFAESADVETETMRSWGLEAETLKAPADGETVIGDWRMPLAWDYTRATLELVEPEQKLLADTDDLPTHLVMWSGPTPETGIEAPIVYIPDAHEPGSYDGCDIQDKIVLVDVDARTAKIHVFKNGGKAIVSCFNKHPDKIPDAVSWTNGWSDDPGGWAFHNGDTPLPGMNVSPNTGDMLKELLKGTGRVVLNMTVDSRYYEGDIPLSTGVLPGKDTGQEVLALGHGQEQGANDNASGCAAMMEALRAIKSAVDKGDLPEPERSLRVLITNEVYGTLAFGDLRPDIVEQTLAGLDVDSVGQDQNRAEASLAICLNPYASAHYSDTLTVNLFEQWMRKKNPRFSFSTGDFGLDDNLFTDPKYGVPTVLIDTPGDVRWHTSADTMEMIDPENLHLVTLMTASFLYSIGSAGEKQARSFAIDSADRWVRKASESVSSELKKALVSDNNNADVLGSIRKKADFLANVAVSEINSTGELVGEDELDSFNEFLHELTGSARTSIQQIAGSAERTTTAASGRSEHTTEEEPDAGIQTKLENAKNVVCIRNFCGTPSYDSLPKEIRRNTPSPRWDSRLHCACFWMDGKRTLAEVIDLTVMEKGGKPAGLLKQIEFMADHGLVTLKKKG